MTNTTFSIDPTATYALSGKLQGVPLAQVSDQLFQQIMEAKELSLKQDYATIPETADNPTYAPYARIVVNDKEVAKIDNHGGVITSNAMADAFTDAIARADALTGGTRGPLLAQARAEQIAAQMKGTIVKESTAMTQGAYDKIPYPKITYNETAMKRDPRYAEMQEIRLSHAAFLAQQIAQDGTSVQSAQTNVD